MTDQELEMLLTSKCESWDLKKKAYDALETILSDTSNKDEINLGGFDRTEVKPIFDRYEYQLDKRNFGSVIRTRFGLYIEDTKNVWLDRLEPIGYYELETDLNGKILDDYFVVEKQKYIDDIGIVSPFQSMNKRLPLEYLRRNHIQYEFVAYISLAGTLFISKQFEGEGRFIKRAYTYLATTDNSKIDLNYLKESKSFLKMMKSYLVKNNLVTEGLKEELQRE